MSQPKTEQAHFPYFPPLDGIRALAMIGILIYHINPAWISGAFICVDIFFVLSGFLITSIILYDMRGGRFSFKEFYFRRVQRLLPNTIVTVSVTLLVLYFLMPVGMAIQPADHGLWTLFNLSNIYVCQFLGDYWGTTAEAAPFTHFWTLGVEEQYYILFPVVFFVVVRLLRRYVRQVLVLGTMLGFVLCLAGTYTHPTFTFYMLPTRLWELLLGSAIACFFYPPHLPPRKITFPRGVREILGLAGILSIFTAFTIPEGTFAFPGWLALAPTIGTGLMIVSIVTGTSTVSCLLGTKPFVEIGKMSYSLYLWHWPAIIFGKYQAQINGFPVLTGAILGAVAGVILSVIAYFAVECPLRQRRKEGRSWRLAIIATGFAASTAFCVYLANSPPEQTKTFGVQIKTSNRYNVGLGPKAAPRLPPNARGFDLAADQVPPQPEDVWKEGGIIKVHGSNPTPRVVVFGSSHALMYSPLVDDICRTRSVSAAFFGMYGVVPFFINEHQKPFDEARKKWIREWNPDIIFFIHRWDMAVSQNAKKDKSAPDVQTFVKNIEKLLSETAHLKSKIAIVMQVPVTALSEEFNLRATVEYLTKVQGKRPKLQPDKYDAYRRELSAAADTLAAKHPRLIILHPENTLYEADGSIRYADGSTFYYLDDDHLLDIGAELSRDIFEKAIDDALGQK